MSTPPGRDHGNPSTACRVMAYVSCYADLYGTACLLCCQDMCVRYADGTCLHWPSDSTTLTYVTEDLRAIVVPVARGMSRVPHNMQDKLQIASFFQKLFANPDDRVRFAQPGMSSYEACLRGVPVCDLSSTVQTKETQHDATQDRQGDATQDVHRTAQESVQDSTTQSKPDHVHVTYLTHCDLTQGCDVPFTVRSAPLPRADVSCAPPSMLCWEDIDESSSEGAQGTLRAFAPCDVEGGVEDDSWFDD